MVDSKFGVVFTQSGVPVANSSDYQKVLDSHWRFLEIEAENDIAISLPAAAATVAGRYYEKTVILRHNLGFLPLFEANSNAEIYSDENTLFIRRLISGSIASQNVTGSYRLYNLPVTQDYTAPSEVVSGASSPKTDFGIKFVDGRVPNPPPADNGIQGFSVDTTKKILSIHKTGLFTFVAGVDQPVPHGMGYPPTYLMAPLNEDEAFFSLGTSSYMGPAILGKPVCYVSATNINLTFRGIQSAFAGKYAIVILKDPTEIAQ